MFVLEPVSKIGTPGVAEQSSSFVIMHDRQHRVGTQEPLVLGGSGATVDAQRARDRRELVLETAAGFAERGDAGEHVGRLPE